MLVFPKSHEKMEQVIVIRLKHQTEAAVFFLDLVHDHLADDSVQRSLRRQCAAVRIAGAGKGTVRMSVVFALKLLKTVGSRGSVGSLFRRRAA